MGDIGGIDNPDLGEPEVPCVPNKQSWTIEDDGHDVKLDFVDEARFETLTSDVGAAAQRDDGSAGGMLRRIDRLGDAVDEHELNCAIEGSGGRAVGDDEVGHAVGRVVPAIRIVASAERAATQEQRARLIDEFVDDRLAGLRRVELPIVETAVRAAGG